MALLDGETIRRIDRERKSSCVASGYCLVPLFVTMTTRARAGGTEGHSGEAEAMSIRRS